MGMGAPFLYLIQAVQDIQNDLVGWDILHIIAVVFIADYAKLVHHYHSRHATQLEKVDFLVVKVGNFMSRVRQADKRQVFTFPVKDVFAGVIRADGKDFRVTRGKSCIIIAQARKMGAAVRSHKTTQECQNDILFPTEIRQAVKLAIKIGEFKIWGTLPNDGLFSFRHTFLSTQLVKHSDVRCDKKPEFVFEIF
jgi:hypothetical protein